MFTFFFFGLQKNLTNCSGLLETVKIIFRLVWESLDILTKINNSMTEGEILWRSLYEGVFRYVYIFPPFGKQIIKWRKEKILWDEKNNFWQTGKENTGIKHRNEEKSDKLFWNGWRLSRMIFLSCLRKDCIFKYYWVENIQKNKIYQSAENRNYTQGYICENIYS